MHRPSALNMLLICLISAGVLLAGGGCGQGKIVGDTQQKTAEGFGRAIEAGKLELAAQAFDYVTQARRDNEDWDSIAQGQRDLIVKKLQEERAQTLGAIQSKLGSGVAVGEAKDGFVTLKGSAGSVMLAMIELDGKWYVSQVW